MTWSDRVHRAALLALTGMAAVSPAWGVAQVPGPIEIGPSWGQPSADGSVSLYTTIVNHGVLSDRLRAGECSGFGDAALTGLDPATQGNAADEKGILLGPGATAVLEPGGAHLIHTNATRAREAGTLVSCTLTFVHSGQRLVVFSMGRPGPAVTEP